MKILYLVDTDIDLDDAEDRAEEFAQFIKNSTGITVKSFFEPKYFRDYPTLPDKKTKRPEDSWLKSIGEDVYRRYSGEGTDHVVLWIHKDNWQSDGIWGTNWSNLYSGYQMHYCRWDSSNKYNTFGTLFHEWHHSLDAVCQTYVGEDIEALMGVADWDDDITHGGSERWEYIRYKQNVESIQAIAVFLRQAYAKRDAIYQQKIGKMQKTISLLERIIILLRQLNSQKHTIK